MDSLTQAIEANDALEDEPLEVIMQTMAAEVRAAWDVIVAERRQRIGVAVAHAISEIQAA